MKMSEFLKVKDYSYEEYCDYLQAKYGIGRANYMTPSFNKNQRCSRTSEGLFVHHKAENKMIMLSTKEYAMICPYEWQMKENLVYCDYLEHLFLHVLICKYPSPEKVDAVDVGIGGTIDFLVPELNDLYSGWMPKQPWRINCRAKIIDDKDVYLEILKMLGTYLTQERKIPLVILYSSFNEKYGIWSRDKNTKLFKEIAEISA